jgi:hypothetical protein
MRLYIYDMNRHVSVGRWPSLRNLLGSVEVQPRFVYCVDPATGMIVRAAEVYGSSPER